MKKLDVGHTDAPLCDELFFPVLFSRFFSWSLDFNSLIVLWLGVHVFEFILLEF
jgi:hypothetical protein